MNFHFGWPWALYLLWLVPLLAAGWLALERRRLQARRRFISDAMFGKLAPPLDSARRTAQAAFAFAGVLFALLALARPRWGMREEKVMLRSRDLVIAIDVSRSMLARDVRPSRLERAKADVMDLLKALRGDRVGLLVFRGRAVPLCPLTADYAYLEFVLDTVNVNSAPAGETNIGDAIAKAMDMFDADSGAHRALIIISDGEDLSGEVKHAAEAAAGRGITIFTVGLGDPSGSRVPAEPDSQAYLEHDGQPVISRLDQETLRFVAEKTGGSYVPVATGNVDLGRIYREHISRVAAREMEEIFQHGYVERYRLFLLPAVLLLLAAAALSRGRPAAASVARKTSKSSGRQAAATAAAVFAFFGAAASRAQPLPVTNPAPPSALPEIMARDKLPIVESDVEVPPGREGARLGQKFYNSGQYSEAAKAFLEASKEVGPAAADKYLYNAACALFKAGRYNDAAGLFERLAVNNFAGLSPYACLHNLGCALYEAQRAAQPKGEEKDALKQMSENLKMLERSIGAFQEALRLKPDAQQTKENLAAAIVAYDELQKKSHEAEIFSKYGNMPPPQLADLILSRQRELAKGLTGVLADRTPGRIQGFEKLAADQKHNADILAPLKNSLLSALAAPGQSPSDAQQRRQIMEQLNRQLDALAFSMRNTARDLRNLDAGAEKGVKLAEESVYTLWKGVASHEMLLREGIAVESNIVENAVSYAPADNAAKQSEALSLTKLFKQRFEEAYPESGAAQEQPASAQPQQQIEPETRKKILELTDSAEEKQSLAASRFEAGDTGNALPPARESLDLLRQIMDLIPKQEQPQQDQQQQQSQSQQQQQQNNQEQESDRQEPQQQEQPEEQQREEKQKQKQEQAEDKKKEMTAEQAKELLEKARQREQEYIREKMRREHVPLSPPARDW